MQKTSIVEEVLEKIFNPNPNPNRKLNPRVRVGVNSWENDKR